MSWKHHIFALVALSGLSSPALADTIALDSSSIGQAYTFNFDGFADTTAIDGLTSSATFTLTGISGNDYLFDYAVSNTSSAPVTGSRVSSFAFNTNPDIQSAVSTGDFSYTTLSSNYPNGIGTVDVCFKDANTGSCAGGGSGGLLLGESGAGTFTLSFSQPVSSLELSDFFVRYQSIEGVPGVTSASGAGALTSTSAGSTTSSSSGGTPVPEPSMLGLMGLGLVGIALMRRRKHVSSAPQAGLLAA